MMLTILITTTTTTTDNTMYDKHNIPAPEMGNGLHHPPAPMTCQAVIENNSIIVISIIISLITVLLLVLLVVTDKPRALLKSTSLGEPIVFVDYQSKPWGLFKGQ